jgi:hypothetical protein
LSAARQVKREEGNNRSSAAGGNGAPTTQAEYLKLVGDRANIVINETPKVFNLLAALQTHNKLFISRATG